MIKLVGPEEVEGGTRVCLDASNVGAGFTVKTSGLPADTKIEIKIDRARHTATICFLVPVGSEVVGIEVADANSSVVASHALLVK